VSPLLVIVGLLLGDEIGGVAGIFLAVPLMAALKIIVSRAWAARQASVNMRARENRPPDSGGQHVTLADTQAVK
jgi:predicted PurR-regulated permease PerM